MSTATASTLHHNDHERALEAVDIFCRYAGGKCKHLRTDKKGGGLHRFCEQHRQRANLNQRRVDLKRRELRTRRPSSGKHGREVAIPDPIASCRNQAMLTEEDIAILRAILFGDDFGPDDVARLLLPWPEEDEEGMAHSPWRETDCCKMELSSSD